MPLTARADRSLDETLFSVIIPVFERRTELELCLSALMEQHAAPPFEIIVVDDGSRTEVPVILAGGDKASSPCVIRQRHSGAGSARNAGIAVATGQILLFMDSDVIGGTTLLQVIAEAVREHPDDVAFQVRLASRDSRISSRVENARLAAIQQMLTRCDGSISYVNTSAFAVRRSYASQYEGFFDTRVARGEDTLILARLACDGLLPRFVRSTTADHRPVGSLARYLLRHVRIGYQTSEARSQLSMSPGIMLSWSGRLRTLRLLTENSGAGMTGKIVVILAILAYALETCGRAAGHWRLGQHRRPPPVIE